MATPLKEKNRKFIWLIAGLNAAALGLAVNVDGLQAVLRGLWPREFLAMLGGISGLGTVGSVVLNGMLGADMKARLVYLRWRNYMPGSRAFTHYAEADPRIDSKALARVAGGKLPTDPAEQDRTWFRLYETVDTEPAVLQVHQDFLLMRDATGIAVLFFVVGGVVALCASTLKPAAIYLAAVFCEYLFVRRAAAIYGARMVTTVLARVAAAAPAPQKPTLFQP